MTPWRNYTMIFLTMGLVACGSDSSGDPNAGATYGAGGSAAGASASCNGVKASDGTCYKRCSMDSDCDTAMGQACLSAMVNDKPEKLCAKGQSGTSITVNAMPDSMGGGNNMGTNNMGSGNNMGGGNNMGSGNTMGSGNNMSGGNMGSGNNMGGGNMPFGVCPAEIDFKGQLMGDMADAPNGGIFATTPPAMAQSSGLAAIVAQVPDMNEMEVTGSWEVTNALVISTSYITEQDVSRSQTSFWIADGEAAMEVRLYYPEIMAGEYPDFQVRAGQRISFTANKLSRYYSSLQVAGGTNWQLGATNESVYVWEPTNEIGGCGEDNACKQQEEARYVHRVVRVTGLLGDYGDQGSAYDCGGDAKCWGVKYGDGTNSVILRTTSKFVETGQCVTFVGPLSFFQGNPQLNVDNFDWLRSY